MMELGFGMDSGGDRYDGWTDEQTGGQLDRRKAASGRMEDTGRKAKSGK